MVTWRVGGLSKQDYTYPKRDPNWGYDTNEPIKKLLTKPPDPPSTVRKSRRGFSVTLEEGLGFGF